MGQDQRHRPQRDAASDRTAWAGLTRRPRRRPGAPPGAARPRARPWGWSALLSVAVAVSSAAALALPATLAAAVDRALSATAGQGILPVAAVLGLLTGAEALAQYAGPRATAEATARLRAALVRHAMALGPHPSRRTTTGDLVARLTASAAEAGLSVQAAVYAVAQLAMAAGSVLALGLLAPELAAAFLITAPAGWLLLRRHLRRTVRRGEGYQSAQAAVATHLLNALAGRRTIAAAGTLECEIERVLRPLPELGRHGRALWDSQRRVSWSTGLLAPRHRSPSSPSRATNCSPAHSAPATWWPHSATPRWASAASGRPRACWTWPAPGPGTSGSGRSSPSPRPRRDCAPCPRAGARRTARHHRAHPGR
ncbi:ABC transporter transmembrane domain-containing protein [Streptomyces scabiei]|uniref:ABC transporter transmembrane domain-containing protein n=1 Tax=Streptomyces scabiei TaxID=1930 RepID=UPI001FF4BD00|nr:ABC transporter transmembrane domain-containing protein [Streptomyces sp. LBUM 1488]